jgi:hypothetical protein
MNLDTKMAIFQDSIGVNPIFTAPAFEGTSALPFRYFGDLKKSGPVRQENNRQQGHYLKLKPIPPVTTEYLA